MEHSMAASARVDDWAEELGGWDWQEPKRRDVDWDEVEKFLDNSAEPPEPSRSGFWQRFRRSKNLNGN
jgi:hypothetical protein